MKIKLLLGGFGLLMLTVTSPIMAAPNTNTVTETLKSSINRMVNDVKNESDPTAKRKIMGDYLLDKTQKLSQLASMPSLQAYDKKQIGELSSQFHNDLVVLNGSNETNGIANADLDKFAGYVQQEHEQAYQGGGIYLSAGAIIVILLLVIIFLR